MSNQYKIFHKFGGKEANRKIEEAIFKKQKSAYQFEQRCKKGWETPFSTYGRPITRMMKKEGSEKWEQYTVIGNKLVTVSELKEILTNLQNEAQELQ